MKQLKLKLLAILLLSFSVSTIQSQETIPATGADATGNDGTVSYSVGQLVVSTYDGTDGSVAHGVQQPFEISTLVGMEEANGIELVCTAFPNPTTDHLKLKVENFDLKDLTFYLYNMNGNLLESREVFDRETIVQMNRYPRGTYILKMIANSNEVKTFSIIKN